MFFIHIIYKFLILLTNFNKAKGFIFNVFCNFVPKM